MPVLDNRKNHPNQSRPNHPSHSNDAVNFMDYALENLENMTLDDVQLKARQTKPHFINGDSSQQNQLIYGYIQELEQNLSRTRNTRVKATLFPELFQDEDEINYAQLTNCEPNAVARLAECAQVVLLNSLSINLVHFENCFSCQSCFPARKCISCKHRRPSEVAERSDSKARVLVCVCVCVFCFLSIFLAEAPLDRTAI